MASKLSKLMPLFLTKDPVFGPLIESLGITFEDWYLTVKKLPVFLDPVNTPDNWLDSLMQLVGLPRNDAVSNPIKRLLIAGASRWWATKGTESMLEEYLAAYAGTAVDVVRLNTTSFIAGVSTAGTECGTLGGLAWHFEVHVPAASGLTENEIREILKPVVACYEVFTVIFT